MIASGPAPDVSRLAKNVFCKALVRSKGDAKAPVTIPGPLTDLKTIDQCQKAT